MKHSSQSSPGSSRIWLWGGVAVMTVAILLLVFRSGEDVAEPVDAPPGSGHQAGTTSRPDVADESPDPPKTRSSRSADRGASTLDENGGPRFPLVDQILGDEAIGDDVAAARLLQIASDRSLGTAERHEALAHGLMLDFPAFVELAGDSELPLELATRFVEELANQPHGSEPQVQGCLKLMDHSDAEIRTRASEQLAFIVEKESLAENPAALRDAAAEYLKDLREAAEKAESEDPAALKNAADSGQSGAPDMVHDEAEGQAVVPDEVSEGSLDPAE